MATEKTTNKKHIGSMLFLAVLIVITFFMFLRGNDLSELLSAIKSAKPFYLILGVLSMLGFVGCEAVSIKIIMNSLGQRLSFFNCYRYSTVAFYYSSITPSGSGGQPMQLYYMKRDKISLSLCSLTIMILVFIYQVAELGFSGIMFLLKRDFILESVSGVWIFILYGVIFNILVLLLIMMAIFSKTMLQRIVSVVVSFLGKLKIIKHTDATFSSLTEQINEYKQGAEHIKSHPLVLVKVLGMTVLQLSCSFIIPYFVYKAFGLTGHSLLDVLAIQSILTLAVGSLPLPGAVGASEGGFMILFRVLFPVGVLLPAMLLSRGISFYIMLLLCGAAIIVGQVLRTRKERYEQEA